MVIKYRTIILFRTDSDCAALRHSTVPVRLLHYNTRTVHFSGRQGDGKNNMFMGSFQLFKEFAV